MRYEIGAKVFGDWEIVAELGEGAFGKVFRLEKNTYKVKASSALKVLTVPRSASEVREALSEGCDEQSVTEQFHELVEKLVDEIAVMAELKSHPNIVSVEDYTVIPHENAIGWDILIRMELLTPLQDHQRQSPMDETAVRKLATDVCEALVFCQEKKLIHRDIKPGNVFMDSLGHYKLGDFGVARTAEKTISGMSKQGTENYMAPEVYYGREYGSNVDVYSLGVMLYRLMNKNRLPFYPLPPAFPKHSDREQSMIRRLKGEPLPRPCDASDAFAAIILKACEADPKKRYHTAAEMLADLQGESGGEVNTDTSMDSVQKEESLEDFLRGKELTQELLTEIMSTRKLTPSEMMYLMSLLNAKTEEEDDISFDDDTSDELDETVGVFGLRKDSKSGKIDRRDEQRQSFSGLDQYLLTGGESEQKEQERKGMDTVWGSWNEWREDSTDEMKDHTFCDERDLGVPEDGEEEDDFDATVGVFGNASKRGVQKNGSTATTKKTDPLKNTTVKKEIRTTRVSGTPKDLAELNLTVRTYNILKRAGINTVEDLCGRTLEDVKDIANLGPKAVEEILTALMTHGLRLSSGKSIKQKRQEEKRQWTLAYWKKHLPDLFAANAKQIHGSFIAREKGTWIYFAPDISANVCASAIHNITETHTSRFGVSITVSDGKTKWVKRDDVLGILDVSIETTLCKRGIVVTEDYLFLNLGNTAKNSPEVAIIPYKRFEDGYTQVTGGMLKAKRTVLCWRLTDSLAVHRYESGISSMVDYDKLLQCLRGVSRVHRERF